MKDDIIPPEPKKAEIDTSSLDAAKDELLSAVQSGAIREGRAESGLTIDNVFDKNQSLDEKLEGSAALSSTIDNSQQESNSLISDETAVEEPQNFYRAPEVDISKLPTERSRNQMGDRDVVSNVKIAGVQNGRIRNFKLEKEDMPRKQKRKTPLRVLGFIVLVILIIAIVGVVGLTIWYKSNLGGQACDGECQTEFVVASGDSTSVIAKNLEEKGVIRNALSFELYVRLEAKDKNLKAGSYTLSPELSVAEIVEKFNMGAGEATRDVRFLPGDTVMNHKKVLLSLGYSEESIDAALAKTYSYTDLSGCKTDIFEGRAEGASIEGYIYGDTYNVYTKSTVEEILLKPMSKMCEIIERNNLKDKFAKQGLTLYQGITLASIVQRESGTLVDDMPKVAKVFLNRLGSGIQLGSDAVIGYRADQLNPNRDKTDMSYLQTIQCPWNSRFCKGLPPTPISSPKEEALLAVANPDSHDYYYFLTGDDQKMYYANTEAEHNANAQKYCQKLCGYL